MAAKYTAAPLPRIAALYPRVSTRQQDAADKTSLATQEQGCHTQALADGFAVEERYIFRERHSGEEWYERPELTRLREAARRGEFAAVYVHSVERLSRDPIHLGIILDELTRAGVKVVFVTEDLEDSPDAALIRFIKGYAGKVENERRKERSVRAKRERARQGKLIPSNRPLYGYRWANERKEAQVPDPLTAPIVRRIYDLACAGKTLRGIAAQLTAEGVPTPTGKHAAWDANTIRWILWHPTYWGQPAALRYQEVAVEKHMRQFYAHKSRSVARPADEQIPLPTTAAPPLVSAEVAEEVHQRLRLNQQQAIRNNRHPELSLLRGGYARCGYCHRVMGFWTTRDDKDPEKLRSRYACHMTGRVEKVCASRTAIEAHKLDSAAWAKLCEILITPGLIEREVQLMQETEDPGASTFAVINQQIADITRDIDRKRRFAELLEDERDQAREAAEINELRRRQSALEDARTAAQRYYAAWQDKREGLEHTLDYRDRVAGKLDGATYERKRQVLAELQAEVRVYRTDRKPRAEIIVNLPISGAMVHALDIDRPTDPDSIVIRSLSPP
jgi:site-specific DNA recombinase